MNLLDRQPAAQAARAGLCDTGIRRHRCGFYLRKGPMASDKIEILSDSDFKKKVIDAAVPVLVDFWAEWCAPCRRLAPTVDALATEFEGKLVVGKLNVDENPTTPVEFSIRGIPTLLLFKGGQVVEAVVGALPKDEIKRLIEPHL